MKVVQVSQFFNYRQMTWSELIKAKETPVLPSTDGTTFLWTETPELMEYVVNQKLPVGEVLLMEGENDSIEVFKSNYDTSD